MQRSYIKKFILIAAVVAVLVAFFCLASCGGGVIKRRVRWYVAYCEGYAPHDVTAMGGAGYNLSYRGNDYVAAALRTVRDLGANEEDWAKFVEELKRRKG